MHLVLASDHAGRDLRIFLEQNLLQWQHRLTILGCHSEQPCDYVDFAQKVVASLQSEQLDFGLLVCGTGLGMSMAANRFSGIRAAVCTNEYMAQAARAHNDANILCLGQRVIGAGLALEIVRTFLQTPFAKGRHEQRLLKLS